MRRHLFCWLCGQVFRSLGLRLSSTGADGLDSGQALLPSLKLYSQEWTSFHRRDEPLQPGPNSVQLVLGIMAVSRDFEYREVVRKTWMRQAGVCYWRRKPVDGCSIYVAFVLGRQGDNSSREGERREQGTLLLDIAEGMNSGKSFVWFATALKMFPWATHVGKMDMDTYPHLHKLVSRMNANRSCVNHTSPYEIIGRPSTYCPPTCKPWAGQCPRRDCHGQFRAEGSWDDPVPIGGTEWYYFAGQLYIMSLPLVQQVDWTPLIGDEDRMVSRRVAKTLLQLNSCAAVRRLDAWVHMDHRYHGRKKSNVSNLSLAAARRAQEPKGSH